MCRGKNKYASSLSNPAPWKLAAFNETGYDDLRACMSSLFALLLGLILKIILSSFFIICITSPLLFGPGFYLQILASKPSSSFTPFVLCLYGGASGSDKDVLFQGTGGFRSEQNGVRSL